MHWEPNRWKFTATSLHTMTTELMHDSKEPVDIEHCSGSGCFQHQVNYLASAVQIQELMDLSVECMQDITFDCHSAPLEINEVSLASWIGRDRQQHQFFDGSNPEDQTCKCGTEENCIYAHLSCNCNAKKPVWMKDSGTITNMDLLPIMGFNYGPLEFELEQARVTIGPLKCRGLKVKEDAFLKPVGPTGEKGAPGDRGPQGNTGPMGPRGLQGNPGPKGRTISFAAVKKIGSGSYVRTGQYITYNELIHNEGSGMHAASGTFTAPQGGVYFFTISAVSNGSSKDLYIDVIKNGNKEFDIDDRSEADMTNVSYQWMLRLNQGDSVKLRVAPGSDSLYVDADDQVHFTGQLVSD